MGVASFFMSLHWAYSYKQKRWSISADTLQNVFCRKRILLNFWNFAIILTPIDLSWLAEFNDRWLDQCHVKAAPVTRETKRTLWPRIFFFGSKFGLTTSTCSVFEYSAQFCNRSIPHVIAILMNYRARRLYNTVLSYDFSNLMWSSRSHFSKNLYAS